MTVFGVVSNARLEKEREEDVIKEDGKQDEKTSLNHRPVEKEKKERKYNKKNEEKKGNEKLKTQCTVH